MSNISIRLIPVVGQEFSVTRKNLKWAYQSGSNYFADYFDVQSEVQRSVQITQTSYEALSSTYDLPVLTSATTALDNPVAVGDEFVISDANIVIGTYADQSVTPFIPAPADWTAAATGTGSFTNSDSGDSHVFTGVAVSVTGNNARITQSFTTTGGEGTVVVTFGTVDLDGLAAGTEFSLVLQDQDSNALKTFTTGEIVTGGSVSVAIDDTVTGLILRATALGNGDDLSGVVITIDDISVSLESGAFNINSGYNTNVDYAFNDDLLSFGVDELPQDIAGDSIWLQVGSPLQANYSVWRLGYNALVSAGTRLTLVEDPDDNTQCFTRIAKPQAALVVQWDNDVDYMEDYYANL
jgi:hypothetical protein